ncbi:hypothetical protein VitviT2T_019120 [Vitis vinifera]|uniref:Large ribosomal subunit protein uL4 C-terminal domain-containing protein n=3 Tax=Vitis vinifera TaxID=29760 RepID=A0ABY9CZT5_VITVI|nr:hypothetical protein VitviT2T_019120 [Vitis vinifera]
MARGHRIESVPELPLVIGDSAESVEKTSAAIDILKQVGAYPDVEKAKDSHGIRPEKGKMRNRRYISRKGPLIVYDTEGAKLVKAFRNIPGVEVANVKRLNLLKLAPGGHLGRFIIWTKSAIEKVDSIYGSFDKTSEKKKGYLLPRAKMVNADLARIINSDEVQSVVRPIKKEMKRAPMKKNPLKNLNTMLKLNPYAKTTRRMALLAEAQRVKAKKEKLDKRKGLKAAAKKAAGENDDAQVERRVVMEIEVLGLPMMTNMGLSGSSGPSLLMEGLMPITLMAHTHIESTHLAASMLSNCQASHFRNLFIYLSIFIFHFILFYLILLSHIF